MAGLALVAWFLGFYVYIGNTAGTGWTFLMVMRLLPLLFILQRNTMAHALIFIIHNPF